MSTVYSVIHHQPPSGDQLPPSPSLQGTVNTNKNSFLQNQVSTPPNPSFYPQPQVVSSLVTRPLWGSGSGGLQRKIKEYKRESSQRLEW